MKKILNTVLFSTIIIAVGSVSSCKSKKEVAVTPPKGEVKVEVLCSGPQYFTSKEYFRANSIGESSNQANSKRMALSNARLELAGQIQTTVKAVIDNYFQDMDAGGKQEYTGKYEGLSREVINQELNGTRTICEELTMTPDGKYKTYIAIELAGNDILKAINERVSADDRMKTNYEYEKFKETFNKEMENFK